MASSSEYAEALEVAKAAALAAGEVITRAFNSADKGVKDKGKSTDLVTATDQACETLIRRAIEEKFPDHAFIGEEEVAQAGRTPELTDAPTWMCDPLVSPSPLSAGASFPLYNRRLLVRRKPPR